MGGYVHFLYYFIILFLYLIKRIINSGDFFGSNFLV